MKNLDLLEKYRLRDKEKECYGCNGDSGNGMFKVFIDGRAFFVIASNGGGWDHISVQLKNKKRLPTWDEMCAIKDMFFEPEECVVQYHPAKSEFVNDNEWVLHLWKPTTCEMPKPPIIFV